MKKARISAALRREVRERAGERCEYCLLAESQSFLPHEPDHLIALKHGGKTVSTNLALACFDCNRFKGSDIASLDAVTAEVVSLFNPRTQQWADHFFLHADGRIVPLTAVGRVTESLLRFNLHERLEVRARLLLIGEYQQSAQLKTGSRAREFLC